MHLLFPNKYSLHSFASIFNSPSDSIDLTMDSHLLLSSSLSISRCEIDFLLFAAFSGTLKLFRSEFMLCRSSIFACGALTRVSHRPSFRWDACIASCWSVSWLCDKLHRHIRGVVWHPSYLIGFVRLHLFALISNRASSCNIAWSTNALGAHSLRNAAVLVASYRWVARGLHLVTGTRVDKVRQ